MSEMIEQVANAVSDAMATNERDFHGIARAAIKAMREPTSEMCVAPDVKEWPDDAKAAWRAMIDAALE